MSTALQSSTDTYGSRLPLLLSLTEPVFLEWTGNDAATMAVMPSPLSGRYNPDSQVWESEAGYPIIKDQCGVDHQTLCEGICSGGRDWVSDD